MNNPQPMGFALETQQPAQQPVQYQQPVQQPVQYQMPAQGAAYAPLSEKKMSLEEKVEWCKLMSQGDIVDKKFQGSPANVLFALEYAQAIGVPAINALTSITVINGKPSPMTNLMETLVRQAGHKIWAEVDEENMVAVAHLVRNDMPEHEFVVKWDKAKAEKAKLWGKEGPWSAYPATMLVNRAKSEVIRLGAIEVLAGVTTSAEEQWDIVDGDVVDEPETEKKPARKRGLSAAKKRGQQKRKADEPEQEQEPEPEPDLPDNLSPAAVSILTAAAKSTEEARVQWKAAATLDEAERAYVRAVIEEQISKESN